MNEKFLSCETSIHTFSYTSKNVVYQYLGKVQLEGNMFEMGTNYTFAVSKNKSINAEVGLHYYLATPNSARIFRIAT